MAGQGPDVDLYEILNIERNASKAEIKKAYHKSALNSHPDKVSEGERTEAEVRFKAVSQAYEILHDDDKRGLYDQHGMAAFEKGSGAGAGEGVDLNDILGQMFGMNMGGGMGGMPGMGGARRPRRGDDEEQHYEITLEELYKGKTTKFASTKNTICSHCKGTGGKEKAKPKECDTCKGRGLVQKLQQVGPGMVTPVTANCTTCNGAGKYFKDKDRCKRCKGARTVSERKVLELYIPPGSREGEHIVLKGEADQHPDQETGDLIFTLSETDHITFERAGADLSAELEVTLAEALTGFHRVVLTHLDGRGISIDTTKPRQVLRPEQVLKISGEGMPLKRSDAKGDLYLVVKIDFPGDDWFKSAESVERLRTLLPKPAPEIKAAEIDDVEFENDATLEGFGDSSDDPRRGAQWEDEDGADGGEPQCAQQ